MSRQDQQAASNRGGSGDKRLVPLHKRSRQHFDPGDRKRGEGYYRDGRVSLEIDPSHARARARVQGSEKEPYRVGVDWSQKTSKRAIHVFCDCQRFSSGKACKHVWAVLLALEDRAPDAQPPGRGRVALRKEGASQWKDLGVSGAHRSGQRKGRGGRGRGAPDPASWRAQLSSVRDRVEKGGPPESGNGAPSRDGLRLLVNTLASQRAAGLVLDLFAARDEGGGSSRPAPTTADLGTFESILATGADVRSDALPTVVAALPSEPPHRGRGRGRGRQPRLDPDRVGRVLLSPKLHLAALPRLCGEGVVGWWDGRSRDEAHPLEWDAGAPWHLAIRFDVAGGKARLRGSFERDDESLPLDGPLLVVPGDAMGSPALLVTSETIARLDARRPQDLEWIDILREMGEVVVPKDELAEAIETLFDIPGVPRIEAPDDIELSEESAALTPRLALERDPAGIGPDPPLSAKLSFLYGDLEVSAEAPGSSVVDPETGTFLRRDLDAEHAALVRLLESGVKPVAYGTEHELALAQSDLATVAEPLLADGWVVEVRGTSLRSPNPPALKVESGIDWFEVSGSTDFAGDRVELKRILEAVKRGDRFIDLDDGSKGLLPSSWVETYGSLADLAQDATDGGLKFLSSQALLVDAQLAAMAPPDVDSAFARLRDKLRSFESVQPMKEPRGFRGTLRDYQRDGLGWLTFLREYGLGGILADDMGLGKTVQVLALLRTHRTPSKTTGLPSLVVAPRSLLYNWIEEAARFTPSLKVVEYRGPDREAILETIDKHDIVVTTYGTLRLDIDALSKVEFDTVVLDEAQAIKNRDSQSAKATRLLKARHRLALTGTPIENHLGELGSIFEFLNPGLLGNMPRLDVLVTGRQASAEELQLVAEGIRPFILRRTKAEVLDDLPPKTEQVLYCDLRPEQRDLYDKLRAAYQASLLEKVESQGVGGSSMDVLEALLRLRQVACHPGLVDDEWTEAGSAKLESLFEQVDEVLDEGHKLIVFSQFTKLLAFVRSHLDEREIPYAYLDGQTRDRSAPVESFQNDPRTNVFLISLKAGGVGLNLTAAEYVFLLDPWWNPAVEAQAIDRAHRIGQTQPVFAYRMIARDTVEEKILELQRSKKHLAETVLDGEGTPVSNLTAEDLRLLLS